MSAVVETSALEVGYAGASVCAPVDLSLPAGGAVALVGANGSGKSTVLRTVLGLLPPLGGVVTVLGGPVDERTAAFRRAVASVLDEAAWFPALTVAEHLDLLARGHGVRDVEDVVDEILVDVGLWDQADAMPGALSSGQRRRLLLASAFVRPRTLLVLDEPEQRLDTAMRAQVAERLLAEKDAGVAVLFATHDRELLVTVADEAVLVGDGQCPVLDPEEAATVLRSTPT